MSKPEQPLVVIEGQEPAGEWQQVRGGPGRRGTRGHVARHLPPPRGARKLSLAHVETESEPGCFSVNQLLWKIQFTGDAVCTTERAGCDLGQVRPPAQPAPGWTEKVPLREPLSPCPRGSVSPIPGVAVVSAPCVSSVLRLAPRVTRPRGAPAALPPLRPSSAGHCAQPTVHSPSPAGGRAACFRPRLARTP